MSTPAMTLTRRLGYRGGAALPLLACAARHDGGARRCDGPLRAAIELPLALLLPGASILAAARGRRPARPATDVGLAVVLSFAAWILIALTCYVLAQPFTTTAVIVGADLIVVASAAVCLARAAPLATLVGTTAGRVPAVQLPDLCARRPRGRRDRGGRHARAQRAGAVHPAVHRGRPRRALGGRPIVGRGHGRAPPVSVEISVANHTHAPKTYRLVPAMRDARWGTQTFELAAGDELARPRQRDDPEGRVPAPPPRVRARGRRARARSAP